MPMEATKSIDEKQEVKNTNVSTNKVDYTNPSKRIMKENDSLAKQEQTEADDLLPENIEKRRWELAKRVDNMEEWETKESYKKLLGIVQVVINEEDRSTANDLLTQVEARLNTNNIKTEKEIPTQKNTETKKEEIKKPENAQKIKEQDITRNAESKGNNKKWLEGLLDDEKRMEENKWITIVQKNP